MRGTRLGSPPRSTPWAPQPVRGWPACLKLVTGGFGDAMLRQMFQHVLGMLGIGWT